MAIRSPTPPSASSLSPKPSPFRGMDPFLEVNPRWEAFHAWFVRELARQAFPKAQELGCWIDVERTVYQREPSSEIVLIGERDQTVGVEYIQPCVERAADPA